MPKQLRAVSIDYVLDFPGTIHEIPKPEHHRQKAVAALEHLQAIGRLMHLVEIAETKGVATGFNERRLETLAQATQGLGSLIDMLCDGAITEIELMGDTMVQYSIKTMAKELGRIERRRRAK